MDFTKTENNRVTIAYFEWLGFENVNGAFVKNGFEGEIQFEGGGFWYCKNNEAIKEIVIEKDINDIFIDQKYSSKLKSEQNKIEMEKNLTKD